jgi:hypothetical protein
MAFYRGCTASVSFCTVFLPMTEWKLNVDGERIDVSDYDQQTFKSIVGMRTATISLSGPYPSSIIGYGYGLATGDDLLVKLYLDPEFYYFLGQCYVSLENKNQAILAFETFQKKKPGI